MTREFGWTRAQFSSGFTIQMLLLLLLSPFVGRAVDRIGPRRMALFGIVPYMLALSALSLAGGSIMEWRLLCIVQGIGLALISPVVWITAVVGRFNASRGMALAITLAGIAVAGAIWPLISVFYIEALGWRAAFPALALSWGIVVLPLTYFFFFGPRDVAGASTAPVPSETARAATAKEDRASIKQALRSRTFFCLAFSGGIFATASLGFTVHLVPILHSSGFDLTTAASIAGAAGIAALVGRLGTGFLLDRLPAKQVGLVAFLLPIVVVGLLLWADGSFTVTLIAVVLFGLTAGAESDVLTYLASRLLPRRIFASVYAIITAVFAVFASMGPLLASRVADVSGTYDVFLMLMVPLVTVGAGLIWLIPPLAPPQRGQSHG
jgi:MFS family permease